MRQLIQIYLIGLCLIISENSFSQTSRVERKGNFFSTTQQKYFHEVIEPWRYDFLQNIKLTYTEKGVGKLTFWRSEPIVDAKSGRKWKPNISFDVFLLTDRPDLKHLSDSLKLNSTCDSINIGGDIFLVGHFVLFNSETCIDCASTTKIDYCRNFVKRFLNSVTDKEIMDFEKILAQLEIRRQKFKH